MPGKPKKTKSKKAKSEKSLARTLNTSMLNFETTMNNAAINLNWAYNDTELLNKEENWQTQSRGAQLKQRQQQFFSKVKLKKTTALMNELKDLRKEIEQGMQDIFAINETLVMAQKASEGQASNEEADQFIEDKQNELIDKMVDVTALILRGQDVGKEIDDLIGKYTSQLIRGRKEFKQFDASKQWFSRWCKGIGEILAHFFAQQFANQQSALKLQRHKKSITKQYDGVKQDSAKKSDIFNDVTIADLKERYQDTFKLGTKDPFPKPPESPQTPKSLHIDTSIKQLYDCHNDFITEYNKMFKTPPKQSKKASNTNEGRKKPT